jgi:hypothetical protein
LGRVAAQGQCSCEKRAQRALGPCYHAPQNTKNPIRGISKPRSWRVSSSLARMFENPFTRSILANQRPWQASCKRGTMRGRRHASFCVALFTSISINIIREFTRASCKYRARLPAAGSGQQTTVALQARVVHSFLAVLPSLNRAVLGSASQLDNRPPACSGGPLTS